MERSPELEAWIRELLTASDRSAVADTIAHGDDVLVIGINEYQWIEGGEEARQAWKLTPTIPAEVQDVRCYQEGPVAWMAARIVFPLRDGTHVSTRVTGVMRRELDSWKMVQTHASVAR